MKIIKSIIGLATLGVVFLSSCKKEGENIFNMFTDVEVTLHDSHPFSITGYKLVNDGDSVYIDYTVNSKNQDMYAMCLLEVGKSTPTKTVLDDSQRRSYSGVIKMKATKIGKTSYRIYPLDKVGVYLGDGGKMVTIDVAANMGYYNQRFARLPDSVSKEGACYGSLTTGELFTYNQIAADPALSSKIDFGIYRKFFPLVLNTNGSVKENPHFKYYLYSLSASPLPFTHFDISTWTKRETLFSKTYTTGSSDFKNYTSGSTLGTAAAKATIDMKGPIEIAVVVPGIPTSTIPKPVSNSMVYFKTPEGKLGALYLSSLGTNYQTGEYLVFQMKYQK